MGRLTPEEYEKTKSIVEEFQKPGGRGERLHQKLLARAQSRRNWLEDWWLKYAYLIYRCPLPVNISYYFLFDEKENRQDVSPTLQGALYIKGALDFRHILDTETLPVDKMRGTVPMDMHQFERLFTTTRNPQKDADTLTFLPPANYVVVLSNNQVFLLDVYHNNDPSKPLSVKELQHQLERIREESRRNTSDIKSLPALTSEDRDVWAKWKGELERLSPSNRENFDAIDRGLFVLSLDEEAPSDSDAAGKLCLAGNAGNRWLDKIFNLIVFSNGRGGLIGEHTPIDAPTAGMMADHMTYFINKNRDALLSAPSSSATLAAPRKLRWQVNSQVEEAVDVALKNYDKLASDVDYKILLFKSYGADWLKDKAKLSPDAYVQVAMQLAYYRLTGTGTATYETGATRQFYHGRTETVRSFAQPSVEFSKAMQDPSVSAEVKIDKLRKAVDYHSKVLMSEAVAGKGLDRHLLGLKILALEEEADQPLPDIFADKAYKESATWRLSTSNMPGQTYISGFGPGTFDGFGVCYGTRRDMLQFSISSYFSCKETDSARFRDVLRNTLVDIGSLIDSHSKL